MSGWNKLAKRKKEPASPHTPHTDNPPSPWRGQVSLQPHQERAIERLRRAPGVLLYHGLGSGKTISSIAAGARLGLDAHAVVPAALRENYRKELAKVQPQTQFDVSSYDAFAKGPGADNRLLIADEGQRLRDPSSRRSVAMLAASQRAAKRLVLSATPIQNTPEELAPIINTVAGRSVLPLGPSFREHFVEEREVDPGFWARLKGVQPGVEQTIKNRGDLAKTVRGLVDYHPSATAGFPRTTYSHEEVEMDPRQRAVYRTVVGKMPKSFFHKMERNLPPSKSEAKNLNAFMTAARIVSNTPQPYQHGMTPEEGLARSPKLLRALTNVRRGIAADPEHKALIYSNYLQGGVLPLASALRHHQVPFGLFTGGMSDKTRKQIIEDYNAGRTKVLLVSGAGAEGLDLKGTREVHVLEPHWNEARIKQVIGRAVRFGSHAHLPPDRQHVRIRTYHSTLPEEGFFKKKRPTSADQYLAGLAKKKQHLIDQFHSVLQQEGSRPL